jgi:hypothetical protein
MAQATWKAFTFVLISSSALTREGTMSCARGRSGEVSPLLALADVASRTSSTGNRPRLVNSRQIKKQFKSLWDLLQTCLHALGSAHLIQE